MTRNAEASLILGAALLTALGVTMVNLAGAGTVDAQVALTFLTSALALTTAFAWNDATRAYFERFPSLRKRGVWIYALVVTAVSVVGVTAMVWLRARAVRKEEEEE